MSMKPTDKTPISDTDLEQSLDLLRDQLGHGHEAEPPALIDQAIRNLAHREVEKRRSPLKWLSGLATAAVLLLTVTIVLQQQPGPVEVMTEPPVQEVLEESSELRMERQAPAAREQQPDDSMDQTTRRKAAAPPPPAVMAEPKAEAGLAAEADAPELYQQRESAAESEAVLMDAGVAGLSAVRQDEPASWRRSPEAWLERLIELRQIGDEEQFVRERDALVEAFPEFELPDEFKAGIE